MMKFGLIFILAFVSGNTWSRKIPLIHMGRNYSLIVPDGSSKTPRPIMLLLHGCRQDPNDILEGTKIEKDAELNKFMILVPEQPYFANTHYCWNWFLPIQQQRNFMNEMGQVVSAIDLVGLRYAIDRNKVIVVGLSAGGVMAHNLTACYPDVFSGTAIHSGLAYKTAESIAEADTVLTSRRLKPASTLGRKMYDCARAIPENKKLNQLLIIHGEKDAMVSINHATLISETNAVWRDYLDDGKKNNSAKKQVTTKRQRFNYGYEAVQTDSQYSDFLERKIIVEGLGHAWGGGKEISEYFDPKAPSSTQFILEFFNLKKK
jgi:poly(hydroxyalkanoate) depolymerase family esterase